RNITQILDLDFSPSGRNMVLSAISGGRTDIFTLNLRGQGRRLTNDVFDDITPVFLNDSTIIYASNFTDLPDSVLTRTPDVSQLPAFFNLFMMEVGDSVVTTRLTNVDTKNYRPRVLNRNMILHLSEQSGITNLMRYGLGSSVSSQVSALNKSVEVFDYSLASNQIAYAVRDGLESQLVVEPFTNLDQFTTSTPRIQLNQAKKLNERLTNRRLQEQKAAGADAGVPGQQQPDGNLPDVDPEDLMIPQPSENRANTLPQSPEQTSSINLDRLRFERRGGIDTDNYVFDTIPPVTPSPNVTNVPGGESLLDAFRKQSLVKRVTGPRQYVPQFIASSLNTSFVVDPL